MKNRYPTQKALATALRTQSSQRAVVGSKSRSASSKRRSASAGPFPICYHHFL
jgi:hypothetical protein